MANSENPTPIMETSRLDPNLLQTHVSAAVENFLKYVHRILLFKVKEFCKYYIPLFECHAIFSHRSIRIKKGMFFFFFQNCM